MFLKVWFLISLKIFQILCGTGFEWINSANGHVPEGALCAGNQNDGEPLFIGRTHYEGSLTVGKIQRSHNCLYIPFGGAEHSVTQYEVLVEKLRSIYTFLSHRTYLFCYSDNAQFHIFCHWEHHHIRSSSTAIKIKESRFLFQFPDFKGIFPP